MKLATKLVSMFMLLILVVIAANGWWSAHEEMRAYEEAEMRDIQRLGTLIRGVVLEGKAHAETLQLIEQMNSDARWFRCEWQCLCHHRVLRTQSHPRGYWN